MPIFAAAPSKNTVKSASLAVSPSSSGRLIFRFEPVRVCARYFTSRIILESMI
jgi:hypothetical protein